MKQNRLDYIDGLRGFAALLIFVYHTWIFTGSPGDTWWNPLHSGFTGVHLFLVLSGFCIYWPFANGRELKWKEYARRRFRRIAPPYYVALFLFAFIALLFGRWGWVWPETPDANLQGMGRQLVSHLLFIHNLLPNHILAVAGPFWSIGLEAQLYMMMPFLVWLSRKRGILVAVSFAGIVTLLFRVLTYQYFGGAQGLLMASPTVLCAFGYSVLGRWFEFALGMLAAQIVALDKVGTLKLPLGILSVSILMFSMWFLYAFGKYHWMTDPLFGLGFFALLMFCAQQQVVINSKNWWHLTLKSRPLIAFGTISYSFYLLHSPLVRWMIEGGRHWASAPLPLFALTLAVFGPIILLVSALFFHFVEKPFLNAPTKCVDGAMLPAEAA